MNAPVYPSNVDKNFSIYTIQTHPDLCYLRHPSGVIVVSLNPNHEAAKLKITKVNWDVKKKGTDQFKTSGKGKKGAKALHPDTRLCLVTSEDGTEYALKFGMKAMCIEMNDKLESNPDLIRTHPQNHGYLAIIMPNSTERRELPNVFDKN
uniref:Protein Abitram n=1 Tax=Rhabditophanes sp. KR3021 TaxID=114890 RepID=A0AC35TQ78_9BILA